jgi:uncharacterized protein
VALYHTPEAAGGCQGCRFFLMCKGQCPGTSIDGDWRNRTEHCEVWRSLFRLMEQELLQEGKIPLSLSRRRVDVEETLVAHWAAGENVSLSRAIESAGTAL